VAPTLSRRELNRATLARQLLLERAPIGVVEATGRLAGLQAQEPRPPFLGLWTRVEGLPREDVLAALQARTLVRGTLMRGTLHLATAEQYAALRPALQPVLTAGLRALGARATTLDPDAVLPAAAELLAERPRDFEELRTALAERFPKADVRALGFTVRMLAPLVMVPTEDRWGHPRSAAFTPAEAWLGTGLGDGAAEALVRPYLAAFGPASAADLGAWSGLTGTRATLDALREELVVFRDEHGRELFDLPDAPRPGADADAPPRLLPEFDNLVLAHQDRTRVLADAHRGEVVTKNLRVRATYLVDGEVAGTSSMARKGRRAVLTLAPFGRAPAKRVRGALEAEAEALLRFAEPDAATYEVSVASR
jgi:hypothetical protein